MAEVARVRWTSPPPTSVDEELVVHDDGTVQLVVRTPRAGGPQLGTWQLQVETGAITSLEGQREIDERHPASDPTAMVAEQLAARTREHPLAVAVFYAAALPGDGLALQAVGAGAVPAAFQLDPAAVVVHYEDAAGNAVGWQPADPVTAGFVSPTPEGLGGLGRPAEIGPGAYGAIALGVRPPPERAVAVAIELSGQLRDAVPRPPEERPFRIRTAAVPLTR